MSYAANKTATATTTTELTGLGWDVLQASLPCIVHRVAGPATYVTSPPRLYREDVAARWAHRNQLLEVLRRERWEVGVEGASASAFLCVLCDCCSQDLEHFRPKVASPPGGLVERARDYLFIDLW
jgi:hypothetical protein